MIVEIAGYFDEHAVLSIDFLNNLTAPADIHVSFEHLVYINSVGVRTWIRWLQTVEKVGHVTLHRCPVIFVRSLNTVYGMVNTRMKVQSFYVPFYDPDSQQRRNLLMVHGTDFFDDGSLVIPSVKNDNDVDLELDVPETYFTFLNHQKIKK